MSYQSTRRTFSKLNYELRTRYEQGNPVRLTVNGKPKLHIMSFRPLVYEEYGFIGNRAPYLAGSLALRSFLLAPDPYGGAMIFAGVEARRQGYGFPMDGHDSQQRQVITDIARLLGYPELKPGPAR